MSSVLSNTYLTRTYSIFDGLRFGLADLQDKFVSEVLIKEHMFGQTAPSLEDPRLVIRERHYKRTKNLELIRYVQYDTVSRNRYSIRLQLIIASGRDYSIENLPRRSSN